MRQTLSLTFLLAIAAGFSACSHGRSRCCPGPTVRPCSAGGQRAAVPTPPARVAQCSDAENWPYYSPSADEPTARAMLLQIQRNAVNWANWGSSHSGVCMPAECQDKWRLDVFDAARECMQLLGQHQNEQAGHDHYDNTCATLYEHVKLAYDLSRYLPDQPEKSGNHVDCLFELNHEDGPMR